MDEIWEKLGPDAMIISTSKRNGRIVMEATTESTKPAMAPSVEAGFSDIFKGQMLAKPTVTGKSRHVWANASHCRRRCRYRWTSSVISRKCETCCQA
jgi:hypothetical protein